ncbi:MAG: nuclear transport factor 2 family protein [Mycobacterium sp.]|nr:nuclear transport factor 2 family protein [Mycobacterium sp.]
MTATVIDRWLSVIEGGQTAQLDDMLAEDAVFYSPAVFTPQHGRAKAATYLRAAEHLFAGTGFHYVNKWIDTNSAVLEFAAVVDGFAVEGVDILHWNDAGKLTSVKVMIRPFKGLQTVIAKMAELLSAQ